MSAYTKGPWHLGLSRSGRWYIYSREQEQPLKPQVKLNKTRTTREMEANARLMAAAPELLEALKAIFEDNCFYHKNGDERAYRMAAEAIAKAEETP